LLGKRAGRCAPERPAGSHGRIVLWNSLWIAHREHAVPTVLSWKGCDRAIPNELRRLWPRLSDFRHLLLHHRPGLRSQVPLMDVLPDATEPHHPEVQDDVSACDRPRHPRALASLGEHRFTGGLCDAGADGKALAAVVPIPHPMRTFFEVRVGLVIALGCTPPPVLQPQGRCRLSHPRDAIGCGLPMLAHLFGPCPAPGRRAKEGLRQLRDREAGRVVIDNPSPREGAPGTLWIVHRFHHGVVRVTGVLER
jgi:hypothetical protein